ncbi:18959_t:CDS:2, partial [Dentiscutata erythropus]
RHQSWHFLTSLEFDFIAFYKNFYGITFPEINAPPILYRFIRDFMLPVETCYLQGIGAIDQFESRNKSKSFFFIVIVIIKMIYGLDGRFTTTETNIDDFIEPIEKKIQESNFCVEVPVKHSSTSKSCSFSKDPMKHL